MNGDEDYVIKSVETNLSIIEFGTDHSDDYYPCFYFHYYPQNMGVNKKIAIIKNLLNKIS